MPTRSTTLRPDSCPDELLKRYHDQGEPSWYNVVAGWTSGGMGFGRQSSNEDSE